MEWMDFNKFFSKNLNRLVFSISITVAAFVFMNVITKTVTDVARPSKPSVKLTALVAPAKYIITNGI